MAVVAERSTDGSDEGPQARGSEVQATRDREGEVGHDAQGSGHTRERRVPESVSPKLLCTQTQGRAVMRPLGPRSLGDSGSPMRRLRSEEPDELKAHVRICGGSRATSPAPTRQGTAR